jgi:hypothetical protein
MDQEYKREKFMTNLQVIKEIRDNPEMFGQLIDDTIVRLKVELWAKTNPEIKLTLDRPSFIEWVLRRRRTVIVRADDVMIEPPKDIDRTVRVYQAKIMQEEGRMIWR